MSISTGQSNIMALLVGPVRANYHYLRASSVRQDHEATVFFLSLRRGVIAEWPFDQIVKLRWLQNHK